MKTLTEQIREALNLIGPYYNDEVDLSGHGDALKVILNAIKERDAYVIGDEWDDFEIVGQEVNIVKKSQWKRAEETL